MKLPLRIGATILLGLMASLGRGADGGSVVQYILLRDGAVIRGDVKEEPGKILIRQREGSEIRVPRERVACWAEGVKGLYQYQVDQRPKQTLESHLDLARWCIRNDYFSGAAREIVAAHRLSPGNEQILRLERDLRRGADAAARPAEPEVMVDVATAGLPPSAHPATPPLDSESFRQFATMIQPLMINQCNTAACHGNATDAALQLNSPPEGHGRPTAKMTQENFEAVVRWIDATHPEASPLLVRAEQAHGGAEEPPLGPRQGLALRNLQHWVHSMVARDGRMDSASSSMASMDGESAVAAGGAMDSPAGSPVRLPRFEDPFDPDLFNRRVHGP